jgi:hypothetical protein
MQKRIIRNLQIGCPKLLDEGDVAVPTNIELVRTFRHQR